MKAIFFELSDLSKDFYSLLWWIQKRKVILVFTL